MRHKCKECRGASRLNSHQPSGLYHSTSRRNFEGLTHHVFTLVLTRFPCHLNPLYPRPRRVMSHFLLLNDSMPTQPNRTFASIIAAARVVSAFIILHTIWITANVSSKLISLVHTSFFPVLPLLENLLRSSSDEDVVDNSEEISEFGELPLHSNERSRFSSHSYGNVVEAVVLYWLFFFLRYRNRGRVGSANRLNGLVDNG